MSRTFLKACTLAAGLGLLMAACRDAPTTVDQKPTVNAPRLATVDLITPDSVNVGGAIWLSGLTFKVGTGVINPFLSIQNAGSEQGFNTDGSPLPYDDTRSNFTDALPLNVVPTFKHGGILYREFILDANEANSGVDAQFSIDIFDVWVCNDSNAPTWTTYSQFESNSNCLKIYSLPAGDTLRATDGKTNGSGNSLDYEILIPESVFPAADVAACPYNPDASPCGRWIILKTAMGGLGGDYVTGSTFEEFSTIKRGYVTVAKTASTAYTRTWPWTLTKVVNPSSMMMFTGQSDTADYTVVATKGAAVTSAWVVSGTITITNPGSVVDTIASVADSLSNGTAITPSCGVTFPYALAAGGTLNCTYTYSGFLSDPTGLSLTNGTVVTLIDGAVNTASASVNWGAATITDVNNTVTVTDTRYPADITKMHTDTLGVTSATHTYTYPRVFTCDADSGRHPNRAKIVETGAQADTAVTVACGHLTIDKTQTPRLKTTYTWTIEKTVTPATWALFKGEDGTSQYGITIHRSVLSNVYTDSGTVTVGNTASMVAKGISVNDCVQGSTDGTTWTNLACQTLATGDSLLASPATKNYGFGITFVPGANTSFRNRAIIAMAGTSAGDTIDKSFTLPASPTTTVDATATILDPTLAINQTGQADGANLTPTKKFTCATGSGTTNTQNIASVKGDNSGTVFDQDTANVAVTCYEPTVAKADTATFKRFWHWAIDKGISTDSLTNFDLPTNTATLEEDQSLVVPYKAKLDAVKSDSLWRVRGVITITNPHPTRVAELTSVLDTIQGFGSVSVVCGSLNVPAAGNLKCTFDTGERNTATNPFGTPNRATAYQQLYSFTSALVATPLSPAVPKFGSAPVSFPATPMTETDECVSVTDVLKLMPGGTTVSDTTLQALPPGLCASSSPFSYTFYYHRTYGGAGIALTCNEDNLFKNTATFTTNDTFTQGSDTASINFHRNCEEGCTLTLGYWKTHNDSFKGGAPTDPTWELIGVGKEQTLFLAPENKSGMSWFDVFWTSPKGNVYYTLAHQWMAAYLNTLAGATAPAAVASALSDAADLFHTYTPAQMAQWKGNDALRARALEDQSFLAKFNEGLIGPGHCTEDRTSLLLR